jgi:hypothetical protein
MILTITQALSGWYVIKLWNIESENDKRHLAELINKSEQRRYESPIINVSENRVYIPEVRVYLPLNEVTRSLRYEYSTTPISTSLHLSTVSTVGAQTTETIIRVIKSYRFTKKQNRQ